MIASMPGIDNIYLASPGGNLYMYDTDFYDYLKAIYSDLPQMQNQYYGNNSSWEQDEPPEDY